MTALTALVLSLVGAAPVDHPHTYLLSIGRIPLKDTESVEEFSIETWGARFNAVCRIPGGWQIKAGGSATPEGELAGTGGQGATWFNQTNPKELKRFVLVTLYGPVQREDIGSVPATFKGSATVNNDDGDIKRALTYKNITLTPSSHCPIANVR
jgi:hypothetical protein